MPLKPSMSIVSTVIGCAAGMLETRTINVVLVRPGHGIGADPTPMDKLDEYVADICGLCPPMKARNQSCCGFAL